MNQNKVTLCWPNRVDQAALTGGAWLPSLPLTNVQDRILSKKARTTGTLANDVTSTNQKLYSQDFSNVLWIKNGTSIAPNYAVAPDGTSTATKLTATGGANRIYTYDNTGIIGIKSECLYLKSDITSIVQIVNSEPAGFMQVDLSTGAVSGATGVFSNPLTRVVQSVANGWWRVGYQNANVSAASGSVKYMSVAVGASGQVLIWGWQLESGAEATAYIATGATTVTRTLVSRFEIGLDKSRPIAALALAAHNFSPDAQVRVRFYDDYAKTTLLWDSGRVSAWPAFYTADQFVWGDNGWWSGFNKIDPSADYTALATFIADQVYNVRQITVDIIDPNNPSGYVEIGRVFVSTAWQPTYNMEYAPQHGYINTTGVEESLGQTEFFDRKRQRRTVTFSLGALNISEAFGDIYGMQRDLGVDKEILYFYELQSTVASFARTFLARNQKIDPLSQPYMDRHKGALYLQEIL